MKIISITGLVIKSLTSRVVNVVQTVLLGKGRSGSLLVSIMSTPSSYPGHGATPTGPAPSDARIVVEGRSRGRCCSLFCTFSSARRGKGHEIPDNVTSRVRPRRATGLNVVDIVGSSGSDRGKI